ncbi:hypothetical protein [Kaistella antarctica]|uniref:Uncharacterized domain/N5-glutamine S-adenosyl-L -methionine-dependent methyltransferase fusion protein n=1 Tax=Kaistella antarctica TaxID=266748 RepID=A0A3S5EUG0_9FLAO|nr:hypothetical protein [Kaistella antarctica]KEY19906.1 hypothetical protein HY04_01395 [Kaistella antarctica]SEV96073.1 hypothetical protein SAMN05421765_1494 [Kaistella antarctica]VEH96141.1 uncharacterised domain/N5-glutamine S-adenosyl-L -methionine-dependent methyltransferase fusion protein [Kaistella antarctica]
MMLKEKIRSPQFLLVVASMVLYILCLFFTPFYVANKEADVYSNSLFMVLLGWMAILGGGLIPTIIWLANPLFLFGGFLILNKEKVGVILVGLSVILGLYFTTLDSIIDGESGATTEITKLGAGFYLWISSFIAMFFAGVCMFRNKNLNKF